MSSIPALSHLNTLFPASKSRPQRVPERPEPNRGETSMYRCSPSRGERVRGHWNPGTGRDGEQAGSATERGAHPLLTLLHLTPCPRQKRDREGGERRPAQERAASASAVKWPEAEGRPGLTPEPGSARQWLLARRICLMRSRNPPHGLQGIRPAGKRKNAGERHAEKSPAPAADQRAASLSKAPEEREPRMASRRPPGSSA